jgi:hypothetical protein
MVMYHVLFSWCYEKRRVSSSEGGLGAAGSGQKKLPVVGCKLIAKFAQSN